MHQNLIQSEGTKTLPQLMTRIRMARLSPLAAVVLGLAASLSPELVRVRNIHGAYREKATSIASIKHRSNVSGPHQVSAGVL
jgi:hypothetical protein